MRLARIFLSALLVGWFGRSDLAVWQASRAGAPAKAFSWSQFGVAGSGFGWGQSTKGVGVKVGGKHKLMATYTSVGAVNTGPSGDSNGDYVEAGTYDGLPYYQNGAWLVYSSALIWYNGTSLGLTSGSSVYWSNPSGSTTLPLTGWSDSGNIDAYTPPTFSTTADTVAPVPLDASIATDGVTFTLDWTEADSAPVVGATGLTLVGMTHGACTIGSVSTTGTTTTGTLSRALENDETVTLSYTPGDFADSAGTPNAVVAFSGFAVTNNSTLFYAQNIHQAAIGKLNADGSTAPGSGTWEVYNHAGTLLGSSGTPNGWFVSYASSKISVHVPIEATVASSYAVRITSGSNYSSHFNVIAHVGDGTGFIYRGAGVPINAIYPDSNEAPGTGTWEILDPSSSSIANSTAANGWSAAWSEGTVYYLEQLAITAPSGATVATGYKAKVYVASLAANRSAIFEVRAAASPPVPAPIGPWTATDPSIAQGASATVAHTASGTYFNPDPWTIYDGASDSVATTASPGDWLVDMHAPGDGSGNIRVTVPADAMVGDNYSIVGPQGTYYFNVVAPDSLIDIYPPLPAGGILAADGVTLAIDCSEELSPPILPDSEPSGYTVKVAGVGQTVDSGSRTGSQQHTLVLHTGILRNAVVTLDYAPGDVTDSALNAMVAFSDLYVVNDSLLYADIIAPKIVGIKGGIFFLYAPSPWSTSWAGILQITSELIASGSLFPASGGVYTPGGALKYLPANTLYTPSWKVSADVGPATAFATAPAISITGSNVVAPASRPDAAIVWNLQKYTSGAWSNVATAVANGASTDISALPAGTPLRWHADFSAVTNAGNSSSDTTSVSDAYTWPGTSVAAPVIASVTDNSATTVPLTIAGTYSSVDLLIGLVGSTPSDVGAVTSTVAKTASGLVAGSPYLAFYKYTRASDSAVFTSTGTPFTTTSDGTPPTSFVPATMADLEVTNLTDVGVDVDLAALPTRAETQGVEYRLRSGTDADYVRAATILTDAGTISISGLTAATRYLLRGWAQNSYGVSHSAVEAIKTDATGDGTAVPDQPDPPTLAGIAPSSDFIAQPAWPSGTASMKLFRGDPDSGGVLIHTFTSADEGAYSDTGLTTGDTYIYYAVAHNSNGDSVKSDPLTVLLIDSRASATWLKPLDGDTIPSGIPAGSARDGDVALLVRVQSTVALDATTPVRIFAGNSEVLGVVRLSGTDADGQYRVYLHTDEFDYMGPVVLKAVPIAISGLQGVAATITVNLNASIYNGAHWFSMVLESSKAADILALNQRMTRAGLWVRRNWLEPDTENPSTEQFWKAYIVSPMGADLADDATADELTAYIQHFQPAIISTPQGTRFIELTGDQTVTGSQSNHTLRALFVGRQALRFDKWTSPCKALTKIEPWGADSGLFVFGQTPAMVFEVTKDGPQTVLDLSTRGMTDATDAARLGDDKVFALNATTVRILDLDSADRDGDFLPLSNGTAEAKTPHSVSALTDHVAVIYASGGNSTLWLHEGRDWQKVFDLAETAGVVRSAGNVLYFTTTAKKLYKYTVGTDTPALLHTHSEDIAAVTVDDSGDVRFADSTGAIFKLGANGPVAAAGLAAAPNALGEYQGAAVALRGAAAGGQTLWLQGIGADGVAVQASAYMAFRTLADVVAIRGLARAFRVLVPGSGDPMKGGIADVTEESLWGVTQANEDEFAYFFRLQIAPASWQSGFRGKYPRREAIYMQPVSMAKAVTS